MYPSVKLCKILQGVQFVVDDEGSPVRAVILKEALESHFGASSIAADWVDCYQRNQPLIDEAALRIHHLKPSSSMVFLHGNEPELGVNLPRQNA